MSDFANGSVDMPVQVPGDNENGDVYRPDGDTFTGKPRTHCCTYRYVAGLRLERALNVTQSEHHIQREWRRGG